MVSPWLGGPDFADFARALHLPAPQIFSLALPLVEIGGGAFLLLDRAVRATAIVLAIDMIFAILLVGIPGLSGHTLRVATTAIGGEIWRLPLEIILLICLLWLARGR